MSNIPYVGEASNLLARSMEEKLQKAPSGAGILFVSVETSPEPGGALSKFTVRVGITRDLEIGTGVAVVKKFLEKEIDGGLGISVVIHRGVPGSSRKPAFQGLGLH